MYCLYLSVFCQLDKSKICLVLFMGKHDTVKIRGISAHCPLSTQGIKAL